MMQKKNVSSTIWIPANWPAPDHIHAGSTTRNGGYSNAPYASLNLAGHVGDDTATVCHNRQYINTELALPDEPAWLEQVHGNKVIDISSNESRQQVDGAYTSHNGHVCVVLTADCLPLLITDTNGEEIAAIHVGWRGLTNNIISLALNKFTNRTENLLAWTGPYIHAEHYEVGDEVRDACLKTTPGASEAFHPSRTGHWFANLGLLVRMQLAERGLTSVSGGEYCTYRDNDRFYSYRREGTTGRIATMIWMDSF